MSTAEKEHTTTRPTEEKAQNIAREEMEEGYKAISEFAKAMFPIVIDSLGIKTKRT